MRAVIYICGHQGAGKTTLAKALAHSTGMLYVSTSEIVKAILKAETDKARPVGRKQLEDICRKSRRAADPPQFEAGLWAELTRLARTTKTGIIIDSQPRNLRQFEGLFAIGGGKMRRLLLWVDTPKRVRRYRISKRRSKQSYVSKREEEEGAWLMVLQELIEHAVPRHKRLQPGRQVDWARISGDDHFVLWPVQRRGVITSNLHGYLALGDLTTSTRAIEIMIHKARKTADLFLKEKA